MKKNVLILDLKINESFNILKFYYLVELLKLFLYFKENNLLGRINFSFFGEY